MSFYVSVYLSIYLSIYQSIYLSTYLSIFLSIYRSIHLSIYRPIYLYIYIYMFESFYLSIHLSIWKEAIMRDLKWMLTGLEGSNSVRLLSIWKLTTLQTQQFCKTSSKKHRCQHQKRSNSARLPFKAGKLSAELTASYLFPSHLSKALCLPRKSEARSYEVLHLSRKIILAKLKIWCSKMQPLSAKSAPWPANIFDRDVSCTAPATRHTTTNTNATTTALHYTTLHYTNYITLHYKYNCNCNYH